MNLINDRKLARRLNAADVSAKERFYYFLSIFLLVQFLLSAFLFSWVDSFTYDQWAIATDIFYFAFAIIGTTIIYHTNKKGDGKAFIERFICLSLPILIQIMLAFFLVVFALSIYHRDMLGEAYTSWTNTQDFIFAMLENGYFYFRLNQSMKIASKAP